MKIELMRIKKVATSLIVVGMIFTTAWAFDARYAKAGEVQAQISVLTNLVLTIKLGDLMRQLFDIERAAEMRKLTHLEKRRKQQILQEIKLIEDKMENK